MNQNVKVQIVQSVTRVRGVTPTGPMGPAGPKGDKGDKGDPGPPGADGADGADGVVQAIVAGSGILVDSSDPAAPEISLDTITAGQIVVDDDGFVNITGEDLATVLADIDTQIASGGGAPGVYEGAIVDGHVVLYLPPSPWGIDANGDPYYDPDGAAPGEQAVVQFDPDTGNPVLIKPTTLEE